MLCVLIRSTLNIQLLCRRSIDFPELAILASRPGVMINLHWLELPMARTTSHGPKGVRAIEVRLYLFWLGTVSTSWNVLFLLMLTSVTVLFAFFFFFFFLQIYFFCVKRQAKTTFRTMWKAEDLIVSVPELTYLLRGLSMPSKKGG